VAEHRLTASQPHNVPNRRFLRSEAPGFIQDGIRLDGDCPLSTLGTAAARSASTASLSHHRMRALAGTDRSSSRRLKDAYVPFAARRPDRDLHAYRRPRDPAEARGAADAVLEPLANSLEEPSFRGSAVRVIRYTLVDLCSRLYDQAAL